MSESCFAISRWAGAAWVLFFILQVWLVRTRNLPWHRRMGYFGAALGGPVRPPLANCPEPFEGAQGKLRGRQLLTADPLNF